MSVTPEKLRGGYYTPAELAAFLSEWAAQDSPSAVLEPSAGDGGLVAAMAQRSPDSRIDAIELNAEEAEKIRDRGYENVHVHVGDAFAWKANHGSVYDAVIGNPPFIRFQTWPEEYRERAFDFMRDCGLNPNRLTNAWVPFVALAAEVLRPGGRLALVLPAELMQVSYAGEIREFLARTFTSLEIVTFKTLVFKGIQQEAILLLGVKAEGSTAARIDVIEATGAEDLAVTFSLKRDAPAADLDHSKEKWTQYYLNSRQIGLLRELQASDGFKPLTSYADVNVGIVTGRNEFFVLRPSEARSLGLMDSCIPLVGRSNQIPGLNFSETDFGGLVARDEKCLLLQLGKTPRSELSQAALEYVEQGERSGFDSGYKLRIRKPTWWNVPSAHPSSGFMLRQIYDSPRIVANSGGALCTDTIHRVFLRDNCNISDLAKRVLNSATFAFSEIHGRSYGGGVLELEPSEARGLPLPSGATETLDLDSLDALQRAKGTAAVLEVTDRVLLTDLGVTAEEQRTVRSAWIALRDRRLQRT